MLHTYTMLLTAERNVTESANIIKYYKLTEETK